VQLILLTDNVGEVCMDITQADFDVNGNVADLLDQVPVNPLCPGESTSFDSCGDIDICAGPSLC